MKVKILYLVFSSLLFTSFSIAQSAIEDFVKKGIQYHDSGDYEKAIETYTKALELDPKSQLVNYEIALSYMSNEDYKKAIKFSDIVLDQNEKYMLEAYMTKGSALDLLGKTKKSIELFEKAIKETGGHYLLFYNLAINYYNEGALEVAEEKAILAIEHNPNHASSHLILANIHNKTGSRTRSILASHYFLFLEPNTGRSEEVLKMLKEKMSSGVTTKENGDTEIQLNLAPDGDDDFSPAELMISMMEASKSTEENKDKSEEDLFCENSRMLFSVVGELKEDKSNDIWWNFYVDFFYELSSSDHFKTYCEYISLSENKKSENWFENNQDKLKAFDEWLKNGND